MAISTAPADRHVLPSIAATRGPYLSRMDPTGNADKLQVVEAIAKKRFSLEESQHMALARRATITRTSDLARNKDPRPRPTPPSNIARDRHLHR